MITTYSNFALMTAIHSGSNSRALIPDLLKGLGAKRVVLFSDKGLADAGIVDKVADIFRLTQNGTGTQLVGIFTEIKQDAGSESVNAAIRYAREVGADSLLAVGGGSVLDTVKGVKFALHHGLTDIKEAIPGGLAYFTWPEAQFIPIPHVAVPTTAGTGSEVSPIAVIYNEEKRVKTNIIHPFISANMAVLDPDLTTGLPPFITAFTGFDALTHAIEALMSPTATGFTDAYALQTIRMFEQNIVEVVKNGSNVKARMEMLQASTMGITAFSFALNAIPVHNLAHAYGALYRIPHGLANAVFLPHVIELIPQHYLKKIGLLAQALDLDKRDKAPEALLEEVVEKIRSLQQEVGLPSDFSGYDIPEDSLATTIAAVQSDPAAMNFPIPVELIEAISSRVAKLKSVQETN
ncbi:MAG TPA: iron-containing alcohol dehydrogenase [Planococcus sp. (in: firmicutes)]|nr:iron-containing alcohol dehydrogenase [Planococcus sp. (in: firmicutes)]